ncbi:hypothetical protein TrST_g9079 [Triparma strigata]|uniref:Exonuclease 1 n=1 Tax=Triparma strigata TaxID=1606541 RepID=A0A9W6ZZZ6_9STRA|nr:hypothetical protein TrST_g9079 [Triparma strigata]
MGIVGLLQQLKQLTIPSNVTNYRDRTLAVDASSWLHKGAYSCAERLNEPNGENSQKQRYVGYVMKRCNELIEYAGIKRIILVFDGSRCPLKSDTNADRRSKREANLREARRMKSLGRHKESQKLFSMCAFVTPLMTRHLTTAIKKQYGVSKDAKVQWVNAPYEADSQLVKLCTDGVADVVVSEDSDILLYCVSGGWKGDVIYKLDKANGECEVINMSWLMEDTDFLAGLKGDFAGYLRLFRTHEKRHGTGRRMFIQACVLSGCDYVPSLPGVGIVGAFKMIVQAADRGGGERIKFCLAGRKGMGKIQEKGNNNDEDEGFFKTVVKDPVAYEELCMKAEAVFFYHRVYAVSDNKCVTFIPVDKTADPLNGGVPSLVRWGEACDFIGPVIEGEDVMKLGNATVGMETVEPRKTSTWINAKSNRGNRGEKNPKNSDRAAFSSGFNLGDDDNDHQPPTKPLHVPKRLEKGKRKKDNQRGSRCGPGSKTAQQLSAFVCKGQTQKPQSVARRVTIDPPPLGLGSDTNDSQEIEEKGGERATTKSSKFFVKEERSLFSQSECSDEVLDDPTNQKSPALLWKKRPAIPSLFGGREGSGAASKPNFNTTSFKSTKKKKGLNIFAQFVNTKKQKGGGDGEGEKGKKPSTFWQSSGKFSLSQSSVCSSEKENLPLYPGAEENGKKAKGKEKKSKLAMSLSRFKFTKKTQGEGGAPVKKRKIE